VAAACSEGPSSTSRSKAAAGSTAESRVGGNGISPITPSPCRSYLLDVPLNLVADRDALITDIRAQVVGIPTVIVIDTLNRSIPGSESKDEDMSAYIRAADAVRLAFNCLVLIVHHCGVVGNRPRGHTSLAGADDAQIAVERDKNGIVIATVEHARDFEAGAVIACKLEPIELGNDTDGDPLSSCIIVPTDAGATDPSSARSTRSPSTCSSGYSRIAASSHPPTSTSRPVTAS
jgi:hypothetical protein